MQDSRQNRDSRPEKGEEADEPLRLQAQPGWLGGDRPGRVADLAQLAARAGRRHLRETGPPDDQRAGTDPGLNFAARSVGGRSASAAFLCTGTDSPVKEDSPALRASAEMMGASAGTLSPSDRTNRSPRTTSRPGIRCRLPSRMTSARGPAMSRSRSRIRSVRAPRGDGDDDRKRGEDGKNDCLERFTEDQIGRSAGQKHEQHRLLQHVPDDMVEPPPHRTGKDVRPVLRQPPRAFGRLVRVIAALSATEGIPSAQSLRATVPRWRVLCRRKGG